MIMGSNIGTTVTAQMIRLADISGRSFFLELLKPSTLAPLIAFVGILFYMFNKKEKMKTIGLVLLGFGVLFSGMFAMEAAVLPLRESPWFAQVFSNLSNPILGVLVGAGVTAILQSSSASVGILQALTATGLITWGNAIPIILGQNIGTCATGLIASANASRAAKRVAVSHLYFNVIGTLIFMLVIYSIKALFGMPFLQTAISKGGVADFHTLFNVSTTLLLLPFINWLAKLTERTVPDKKEEKHPELVPVTLDPMLYASPSVAIIQGKTAVWQMADIARLNQQNTVNALSNYSKSDFDLAQQREKMIDSLDVSISNYLINIPNIDITEQDNRAISVLLRFISDFERIGDHAINIIEQGKKLYDQNIVFSPLAQREITGLNQAVGDILSLTISAFDKNDHELAAKVEPLEETIDAMCTLLHQRHIDRLKDGNCTVDAGVVFLEILNDYERISDHCSNIANRLVSDGLDEEVFDLHQMRDTLHKGTEKEYALLLKEYEGKYFSLLNPAEED